MAHEPIAVVGLGCTYPGAHDVRHFWENVLSRRRQFRRLPDVRLPLRDYHDPDRTDPDKTYLRRAAVIDGFEFDWIGRRIPKTTVESTDVVHWLALETTLAALADAGLERDGLPRDRTGVVVGNTLTGEQTRASTMRLRWPFVARSFRAAADARGLPRELVEDVLPALETFYKSVFPPITEDSLAGGLSNTIAGRICNFLDVRGGGYTVDGACSSSLLAVATAANALCNGELDLAFAGGVDVSLDTFELVGFARAGALSDGDIRVYDRAARGFLPGEGCGVVVLERLEDARRNGHHVYALLHGWGVSSDGRGGITAPNAEGQSLALLRAYERAGYSPSSVAFVEGHGTGTPVGDRTELAGIAMAMKRDGEPAARSIGVTSLKSILGHCKAAAGVGGLLKAIAAVDQRVIPPTAGCVDPHEIFGEYGRCLFPVRDGEKLPPNQKIRAGVSAMGFGGINCHVTIESADPPSDRLRPALDERALFASAQDTELFLLSAPSDAALGRRLEELARAADGMADAELADLSAAWLDQAAAGESVRAAVVARSPEDLDERLAELDVLLTGGVPADGAVASNADGTVLLGAPAGAPRIGLLFPGQGSQQLGMARRLVERYDWARELVERADGWMREEGIDDLSRLMHPPLDRCADDDQRRRWKQALAQTEVAQPAICLASLLWLRMLSQLGIRPAAVAGHSLGELTAFHAAGLFDEERLLRLAAARGRAMAAGADVAGTMASLACSLEDAEALVSEAEGYAVVANVNSPRQIVVSGERAAVEGLLEAARARKIAARGLPVSNAFHSDLVAGAADRLRALSWLDERMGAPEVALISCTDGMERREGDPLREHFARQVLARVDFLAVAHAMAKRTDLMLEVGPGSVLKGLTRATLGDEGPACLPVEARPGDDRSLNRAVGAAFVGGAELHAGALVERRLVRPFVAPADKRFLDNPVERPFQVDPKDPSVARPRVAAGAHASVGVSAGGADQAIAVLADYLRDRGRFLADVIRADLSSRGHEPLDVDIPAALPVARAAAAVQPAAPRPAAPAPSVERPPPVEARPARTRRGSTPPGPRDQTPLEALVALAAERTGFPPETIAPDARLLDDLNLDSIKAAELVGTVAARFGVADLDPSGLTNATLTDVGIAIADASGTAGGGAGEPAKGGAAGVDALATLRDIVARRTGFPAETLTPDLRLLDDLNLDSIKAAEVVAEAARAVGMSGELDPSGLGAATLAEVAAKLVPDAGAPGPAADEPAAEEPAAEEPSEAGAAGKWVRDFVIRAVPSAAPPRELRDWRGASAVLLHEPSENDLADLIGSELEGRGAHVRSAGFAEAGAAIDEADLRVAILPRRHLEWSSDRMEDELRLTVARLRSVAAPARGGDEPRTVAWLQFGGGTFGAEPPATGTQAAALGFAASVHHERPDLRVRLIDLSPEAAPGSYARAVVDELSTTEPFAAVGFDAQAVRRERTAVPTDAAHCRPRRIDWSPHQTVLVTGGGRGITALCALAFAEKAGLRAALLGRSPHPAEARGSGIGTREVVQTLSRFAERKLRARYYSCDVADRGSVVDAIHQIERELGPIAAVVHGAGINRPAMVERVSAEAAWAEVRPKLQGALHILRALREEPPRLFVALTSIIGVTGMPGNAWYAFANAALDRLLRDVARTQPETQTLSVAYSVWDEVGMGARLGVLDSLGKMGIEPIPVEEGVRHFVQLCDLVPPDDEVVVTSRLGGLDTWPRPRVQRQDLPFLERIESSEPGIELIARCELSFATDPYLRDHCYEGSHLFPTVFGLEAMAQAALAVTGRDSLQSAVIRDVRLERPIVVEPGGALEIEIVARVEDTPGTGSEGAGELPVEVAIYTARTGFEVPHFSAVFEIDAPVRPPAPTPGTQKVIDPHEHLYGPVLFQGPAFQRLASVTSLEASPAEHTGRMGFAVRARPAEEADPQLGHRSQLVLGDPFARDALLQSLQVIVPQDVCLPIGIARIDLRLDGRPAGGEQACECVLEGLRDKVYTGRVAMGSGGEGFESMRGYRCRVLSQDDELPTVHELLHPGSWEERRLREELTDSAEDLGLRLPSVGLERIEGIHSMPKPQRHQAESGLVRRVADEAARTGSEGEES